MGGEGKSAHNCKVRTHDMKYDERSRSDGHCPRGLSQSNLLINMLDDGDDATNDDVVVVSVDRIVKLLSA